MTSLLRPALAATLLALAGCAGMPVAQQPSMTGNAALASVVLPDLVLGQAGKQDRLLQPGARPDEFLEASELRAFCLPGALGLYGNSFLDARDTQVFNEAMQLGADTARRRHDWNFEAARLNRQIGLLKAFMDGRGGASLTPQRLDALRAEEQAFQRWEARVMQERQKNRDGNLTPAQQRQLQSEAPRYSMGRSALHMVPGALDGVQRNKAILQQRDSALVAEERRYAERLAELYRGALRRQTALPASAASLAQLGQFDMFRSYTIFTCMGRAGPAAAVLDARDADYEKYARGIVLPALPSVYKALAPAATSDGLQADLGRQLPTPHLVSIAMDDPGFTQQVSALRSALLKKEAAALAEQRRQADAAVAAEQRRTRDGFRQKAARKVLPTKEELLPVWMDRVFANTQNFRGNFVNTYVRDGGASFTEQVNMLVAVVKTTRTSMDIDKLSCTPAAAGKIACSWVATATFTRYGLASDDVYSDSAQIKEEFAWTDDGLQCVSACATNVGLEDAPARGRGASGGGGNGRGSDRDSDILRERSSDMAREREERDTARRQAYDADQDWRRDRSNGRCRMGNICN